MGHNYLKNLRELPSLQRRRISISFQLQTCSSPGLRSDPSPKYFGTFCDLKPLRSRFCRRFTESPSFCPDQSSHTSRALDSATPGGNSSRPLVFLQILSFVMFSFFSEETESVKVIASKQKNFCCPQYHPADGASFLKLRCCKQHAMTFNSRNSQDHKDATNSNVLTFD